MSNEDVVAGRIYETDWDGKPVQLRVLWGAQTSYGLRFRCKRLDTNEFVVVRAQALREVA